MSSREYNQLVMTRRERIDAVDQWTWISSDTGAWDGPKDDWEQLRPALIKHCKSFEIVITAGGNQGMYPRLMSDLFNIVYTFEPDPLNFFCLVNNCQKNNIIKIQAALGAKHEMVTVLRNPDMDNVGMHRVIPRENEFNAIPTLRIDDFNFAAPVSLIQLDVEGYEPFALEGARETIVKHRPILCLERSDHTVESKLTEFGYKYLTSAGHADRIFGPA